MTRTLVALLLSLSLLCAGPALAAKHVILMIADGAGFNCWAATSMYQGKWDAAKGKSTQVYDAPGWVHLAASTHPLNTAKLPSGAGQQDPNLVYNPKNAWDPQQGPAWLKSTYTDSAAAATALSTAQKTYNHALNWSDKDATIQPTLSEAAKKAGKSVGVITSVEWSHATPAGLSNAHSRERDAYDEIAKQMVEGCVMDVVMGAGNPDFDNDGQPVRGRKEYKYVGGAEAWQAIEAARAEPGALYHGFRPVSTRAEFEALASGPTPAKVLGTAQAGTTLQQARAGNGNAGPDEDTALNAGVPDLAVMARAAINVLDENPKGFFLMIEGGAVDWANHKNQAGRMIQEQADFVKAVEAVVAWVEANSNWNDTLLILTADHETGMLWGPNSDSDPFDPIVDNGPGKLPGLKYNSKNHTNSLVPVFARGAGSELLAGLVVGQDPVRGPYVDNAGLARLMHQAAGGRPLDSPNPAKAKSRRPARRKVPAPT